MVMVADTMRCRCESDAQRQVKDITWTESDKTYTIRNVPVWFCKTHSCNEEIITSSVQLNVSFLADDMRIGALPLDIEYKETF